MNLITATLIASIFFPSPQKETRVEPKFEAYPDALNALKAVKYQDKRKQIGLAPKWCPHCPAIKAKLPGLEWSDKEVVEYEGKTYLPKQFPCVFDYDSHIFFYDNYLKSEEHLQVEAAKAEQYWIDKGKLSQRTQGILPSIGKIPIKKIVDTAILFMGKEGAWRHTGEAQERDFYGIKAKLPANFEMTWKATNQVWKFQFAHKPFVDLFVLHPSLTGLSYDQKSGRLSLLISSFPDVTIDLTEEK